MDGLAALSVIGDCVVCEVDRDGNPTSCHPCGSTDAQKALTRAQLLSRRRRFVVGAEDEIESDVVVEDSDGMLAAVSEIMGVDMSQVTPYLSAVAPLLSSFGGGDDKAKAAAAAEQAKKEAAEEAKRQAAAKKSSRNTLYVVLGIAGAVVLGGGTYLVARKK